MNKKCKYCLESRNDCNNCPLEQAPTPTITLDELKEIREDIDQKQYTYMADKDYDEGIRFGLMLAYQSIDKKISELEGKE